MVLEVLVDIIQYFYRTGMLFMPEVR